MEHRASVDQVRDLVAGQFPVGSAERIEPLNEGWDNLVYRIGTSWVARFPKHSAAAELLANEIRWLPEMLEGVASPLHKSVPVLAGQPGASYPFCWSVSPYIPGAAAHSEAFSKLSSEAAIRAAMALGEFLAEVHRPRVVPADAPRSPYRGIPLASRSQLFDEHLNRYERAGSNGGAVDLTAIRRGFERSVSAAPRNGPPRWCHGDVHPGNLLLDHGELVGIIDFGDCCIGDPASDLAVGWWWFPPVEREVFQQSYEHALGYHGEDMSLQDSDRWARAQGWAYVLCLAVASAEHSISEMHLSAEHALTEHLGCGEAGQAPQPRSIP